MTKKLRKNIIFAVVLLAIIGLSVGFSAFQKQLFVSDIGMNIRIQEDVRVSNIYVSKTSGNAISNLEDFNINRLYGNITLPESNSYVLYKVDLSNYGNVKSGLLNIINNESGTNYSICDSNGNNCTNDVKTPICNGNNCTLGTTKEMYIKLTSNTTGSKNVDLTFDFEPYNTITYTYFDENTSSFQSEIMSHDTHQVTFTSKPEQVDISGTVTYTYNKTTGVLSITDVNSDINIHAKYLLNDVAETSYTGSDPDNYVRFNNTLYRIITKENIDDGSGNTELRTKITSDSSIGNYIFDNETSIFEDASIYNVLNTTYYNTLDNTSKDLIDDAMFLINVQFSTAGIFNNVIRASSNALKTFVEIGDRTKRFYSIAKIGLISYGDSSSNTTWLNKDQFTINIYELSGGLASNNNNKYFKINPYFDFNKSNSKNINPMILTNTGKVKAIVNGEGTYLDVNVEMPTYPTMYLVTDALITGGNGTRNNPYLLEKSSEGLRSNPTVISGKNLTVNGSSQELVTVSNKTGTVYYSLDGVLDSTNYTDGSTDIPSRSAVGSYDIYYYIPSGNGYKAKSGKVTTKINGITYTIVYRKGANVSSISQTEGSCTTTGSSTSCSVVLPNITANPGYESVGWSLTNGDTTGVLDGESYTISNNSAVLYGNAVMQHNYQNTTTLVYYGLLDDAFSEVSNNQTIKVLQDTYETTDITLPTGKTGIKLDMQTYTVDFSGQDFINNGNLEIMTSSSNANFYNNLNALKNNNNMTISSGVNLYGECDVIENNSTLNVNGGNVSSSECTGLNNNGTANINSGRVSGYGQAISNYGSLIVNGGEVSGDRGIILYSGSELTMNGGTADGRISAIVVNNNSQATITNGTININTAYYTANAIENYGSLTISGGEITTGGVFPTGIKNTGILNMSGGSISVSVSNSTTYNPLGYAINNSGTATITGGDIEVRSTYSRANANTIFSSGILTLGTNDSTVSTTSPSVKAYSTDAGVQAVLIQDGGTFNYYDGILYTQKGQAVFCNSAINIPNGYGISKVQSGDSETVTLVQSNYLNTDTGAYFETLSSAFSAVANNQTIRVMKDLNETTSISLSNTKTGVKLDLNGKTLTTTYAIGVSGELDIYNSSSSDSKITSSASATINDYGSLTINKTSNTNKVTIENTNTTNNTPYTIYMGQGYILEINQNTYIQGTKGIGIYNYGTTTINGGTISAPIAINNIYSFLTLNINGGTITGTGSYGINNGGKLNMTEGEIYGKEYGIYGGGNCLITGGKVSGIKRGIVLTNNMAIVTLGTDDNNVSTSTPIIESTGANNSYGIYNSTAYGSTYTFNFYDGIIKSASGENHALGNVNLTLPDGYGIDKVLVDGVESAFLSKTLYTKVYYNSNDTMGEYTVSSINLNCTISTGNSCAITLPNEITSSVGKNNTSYVGVANSIDSMSSASLEITSSSSFYAIYRQSSITLYYANGNYYTSRSLYRNEYISSNNEMKTVLATGSSSISNYSTANGPYSSSWAGLNHEQTATVEYDSVQSAANSTATTLYSVYRFDVNYDKDDNVSAIGADSGYCLFTRGSVSCGVILPSITPNAGYDVTGWSDSESNIFGSMPGEVYMLTTNNSTLYAHASDANYVNVDTGDTYDTLNDAFTSVANNQTISVIRNVTETTTATLASGKTGVELDLNGKNIKIQVNQIIVNNGELTLFNSNGSSYFNYYKIGSAGGIKNYGTLTLNKENSNGSLLFDLKDSDYGSTSYFLFNNQTGANIIINNQTTILENNLSSVKNSGTITMNGGTLNVGYKYIDNTGGTFILNDGSVKHRVSDGFRYGTVIINGGSINANNSLYDGFYNSVVTMTDGTVTENGMAFNTCNLTMSGGYVGSYKSVIKSGNVTITGGKIRSTKDNTIQTEGTITIGTNDSTVNTDYPIIENTAYSNESQRKYAVYSVNGTINFYDGILKSDSGTGYAINRDPDNMPSGYQVLKEMVNTIEQATLAKIKYATFYYNNDSTLGGFTPATITTYCEVTSGSSCTITVPAEVTSSVGKYNSAYKGVSTSSGNMSSSSLTISANTTYYANYKTSVTNYYYNSSYTSRTLYRNEFFTSGSEMNTVLSTSNTGTTNYTTSTGPNSSLWAGLNHAQSATVEYDSVQAGANSDATTLYTVYRYNVTYQKGANVDSIGSDSGYCLMTSSDTTCGVILPSITPTSGYTSVGWNTTSGATSGTAALSTYMLNSNGRTLYANAIMPMLMAGTIGGITTNFLRTNVQKQDIEKITFANSISGHTANGTDCFDVSKDSNGTVLAWITDTNSNGKYEVTIGQNGGVIASSGFHLFYNLTNLDSFENIDYFDTSNVTNMSNMFCRTGYNSTTFTLNLGNNFDTSKVTNMESMFERIGYSSSNFTLNLGNKFDTSNVMNTNNMFFQTGYSSTVFTLDLGSKFNTSNVTNMESMFYSTGESSTVFTLNLGSKFDTSNVTNMLNMFYCTGRSSTVFTLDLGSKFDTSNVINMQNMFFQTGLSSTVFTLDLGDKFDTTNVTTMNSMFDHTGYSNTTFTLNLGSRFDTSNVTTMLNMFSQTGLSSTVFTLDLGDKFDTSNVTNMNHMFERVGYSNTTFTLDLGDKFDTTNVTDMSAMFSYAGYNSTVFTLDLGSKFDTSSVTKMGSMFDTTGRNSTVFTLNLGSKFDTSNVDNMSYMFERIGYSNPNFTLNLGSKFDTSNVTTMNDMFAYAGYSNPNFALNLGSKFNTSSVTTMNYMFYNSRYLKTIYVPSTFVTTNVTSSTNMFYNCTSLVGGAGTVYSSSHVDASYAHIDGGTPNPGYFTLAS